MKSVQILYFSVWYFGGPNIQVNISAVKSAQAMILI